MQPDDKSPTDVDEFITILSHQLKSPITTIESLLKVIADGYTGDVDPKTSHLIERAITKAKEARELIKDLIHFKQYAEGGKTENGEIDIGQSVLSLVSAVHRSASERSISVTAQIDENVRIVLLGDRTGLEIALRNLLENAVKYSRQNGTVTVTLAHDPRVRMCTIVVKDSGVGIPKDELHAIFTPFYRSAHSRASVAGTGLGLSIVKSIVEGHGGIVTVASVTGEGSAFSITLPYLRTDTNRTKRDDRKKVVIIGGVTAGPKAAARLRRLDESIDITLVEKSEMLSYSGCGLPSYLSGAVKSPKALMTTADNTLRDVHFFESIKNINVLNHTEALDIDRTRRTVDVKNLSSGKTNSLEYDYLILATGAQSNVPDIRGINGKGIYSLYKIEDAEAIKQALSHHSASDIIIIGGGLVGIETAESLISLGGRVTIIEKDTRILGLFDPEISGKIEHKLSGKGVKVVTGAAIREIRKQGDGHAVATDKGVLHADIIILSAGTKPNAALGERAGLAIGGSGGIRVNEFLETSDERIYAVGDCAESINSITKKHTYLPLGSISTKMGRIAADNISGRRVKFPGSIGTTFFRIFDVGVGRTGLDTKSALDAGFDAVSIVVSGLDRAHYSGQARNIVLKLIADRTTLRLLGAQGYGVGDIVKRIEVLACAITASMTLDDVFNLDLGYYPAFNNPIDILQTGCIVLKSKIDGFVDTITLTEFEARHDPSNVIDVSPAPEYEFNMIPGSINVPLENLRTEGLPIGPGDPCILYSRTSSRAYEAYRYLTSKGFTGVRVLEGGYIYWKD